MYQKKIQTVIKRTENIRYSNYIIQIDEVTCLTFFKCNPNSQKNALSLNNSKHY